MDRKTVRLTVAQALVRYLAALKAEVTQPDGRTEVLPYCGGVFSIFGHGNVAGLGEALQAEKAVLPTFRAHNEQGMASAADVTMLVAPGPMLEVTAMMRWRKFVLA